jgi:CarD family transcriptional regulator
MGFQVGDKIIYPNQGVGEIRGVCSRCVGGQDQNFYLVELVSSQSTVMVPVANVNNVGMRKLCSEAQVESLFEILASEGSEPDPDWKTRYKLNLEKMNSGEVCEVARVLKNLFLLSFRKSLSFREKKMFDRARQLVVSEIATVRRQEFDEALEQVEAILTVCNSQSNSNGASPLAD